MHSRALASLVVGSLSLASAGGCSASDNKLFGSTGSFGTGAHGTGATGTGANGTGGAGGGTGNSGLGGGFSFDAGPTDDGGNNGCSAASQIPYVFSTEGTAGKIYSFDPPTKKFTFVATPDCPAAGTPNSMAIDRNLVAWLNYIGGLYTFDLNTKTGCKLAINLSPYPGFSQVGMGFSTDAVGGTAETLYIDGIGGGGLAKVDMATKKVIKIGNFGNDPAVSGQSAELTGTGDARLFGYFTTFPEVRVAQIDKATSSTTSDNTLAGFSPPSDWAFSFWGGDFYLYAYPVLVNNSPFSSVVHYSPATGAVNLSYVKNVGFTIVGAGVSTCAPLKPPT